MYYMHLAFLKLKLIHQIGYDFSVILSILGETLEYLYNQQSETCYIYTDA